MPVGGWGLGARSPTELRGWRQPPARPPFCSGLGPGGGCEPTAVLRPPAVPASLPGVGRGSAQSSQAGSGGGSPTPQAVSPLGLCTRADAAAGAQRAAGGDPVDGVGAAGRLGGFRACSLDVVRACLQTVHPPPARRT